MSKLVFSDKVIYNLNAAALGDLIAAAPSVKWAIDTMHQKTDYRVAMFPDFRDIFSFVPDDKILPVQAEYDTAFSVRKLNVMKGEGRNVCRLTPSRLRLIDYASIGLLGRLLPDEHLHYVPLKPVDISHYGVDFKNAVVITVTSRDSGRVWPSKEVYSFAEYIYKKGFTPVFIGKTGLISIWKTAATTDFIYPGFGLDLTNKTSIAEAASIMSQAACVCTMDSGLMHLAFTTNTPVISGFTKINSKLRIPPRDLNCKTIAIEPNISCQFCESDWQLDFWNFAKCPRGMDTPECSQKMTADAFIDAFNRLNLQLK